MDIYIIFLITFFISIIVCFVFICANLHYKSKHNEVNYLCVFLSVVFLIIAFISLFFII